MLRLLLANGTSRSRVWVALSNVRVCACVRAFRVARFAAFGLAGLVLLVKDGIRRCEQVHDVRPRDWLDARPSIILTADPSD